MRSSKSRSRSKNNRNRNTLGNVVNRVFDSSGPEGKVRGTPQQIIDKYNQLARDAALANDRVAAENFQQHAEHYLRMLSEAQKEVEQRREQQERENRERQQQRDRDRSDHRDQGRDQSRGEGRGEGGQQPEAGYEPQAPRADLDQASVPGLGDQPDLLDTGHDDEEDSGLVETPESRAEIKPKPRSRRSKPSEPAGDAAGAAEGGAAAEAAPEKPKRARKPRKKPEEAASNGGSAPDAAE
ncbi:DUF4167 domain-containing protein [Salipiger sp. H15]|uniref:DUF4167 domain-containing protein n=1 Tax=Alloyangia sp. H15 TaxID=3029062 RepID=A0AAU8AGX3_9RHOB